jgi:hypothetical protein
MPPSDLLAAILIERISRVNDNPTFLVLFFAHPFFEANYSICPIDSRRTASSDSESLMGRALRGDGQRQQILPQQAKWAVLHTGCPGDPP